MFKFPLSLTLPAVALLLAGCAAAPEGEPYWDPHEAVNRKTHAFNVELDQAVFGGLGDGAGVPEPVIRVVANFSNNLGLPGKVLNSVLQGRPEPAVQNTLRFLVNSTLGVGGLFDMAGAEFGLPEQDTDFGETLYVWGVNEGAYMELPVIGPSTERDAFGKVVDALIDPLGFVMTPKQKTIARVARVGKKVGDRMRFGSSVDSILHDSADSYAQSRLLYLQNRRYSLGQSSDADAFDPYEDPYGQ